MLGVLRVSAGCQAEHARMMSRSSLGVELRRRVVAHRPVATRMDQHGGGRAQAGPGGSPGSRAVPLPWPWRSGAFGYPVRRAARERARVQIGRCQVSRSVGVERSVASADVLRCCACQASVSSAGSAGRVAAPDPRESRRPIGQGAGARDVPIRACPAVGASRVRSMRPVLRLACSDHVTFDGRGRDGNVASGRESRRHAQGPERGAGSGGIERVRIEMWGTGKRRPRPGVGGLKAAIDRTQQWFPHTRPRPACLRSRGPKEVTASLFLLGGSPPTLAERNTAAHRLLLNGSGRATQSLSRFGGCSIAG